MKKWYRGTVLFIAVLTIPSCASDKSADEAVKAAGLTVDVIERAITLSFGGNMELAVPLLLEGTEADATDVEIVDCLGLSEWDFKQMAVDPQLSSVKDKNMSVGKAARALANVAIQKAEELGAQGEGEKAALWLLRVDAMGKQLSSAKYNQFLQMQGDAILRDAMKSVPLT